MRLILINLYLSFMKEEHCITLHMDGDKHGDTAMSKLVGKTAAIAAKLVLSGEFEVL